MPDEPVDGGAEPGAESLVFLEEYWDWVAVALFLLVFAGLGVLANNLSAVFLGASLV
jgi:hypothetical protein